MLEFVLSSFALLGIIPIGMALVTEIKEEPTAIVWESDIEKVVKKATSAGKPILMDFFSPT
ncbi:MAG: hypothetical protein E3K32_05730 [wastewater metagenome]|nr:hypothetical protein [Candidatus Loosdrechtia aerotolerans]